MQIQACALGLNTLQGDLAALNYQDNFGRKSYFSNRQ